MKSLRDEVGYSIADEGNPTRDEDGKFSSGGGGSTSRTHTIYRKGGSLGEAGQGKAHPKHGKFVSHAGSEEEAKSKVDKMNKGLSPGEKKYYGLKYHSKPYDPAHHFDD